MTPRNIGSDNLAFDDWYSKRLFSQLSTKQVPFNVSGEGRPCTLSHPALILAEQDFLNSPESFTLRETWKDWKISCFNFQSQELKLFQDSEHFSGWPKDIFKFLQQKPQEAIIHFEHLGSIHLHQNISQHVKKDNLELKDVLLPLWLDYALSSELWSESGKWPRFHDHFHTLFVKFGLLLEQDSPGYYPLALKASFLEEDGFLGKRTENGFLFIPGWDFPLSGLKKLEEVLSRRQSCLF
jgi:hypothetical protein